MNSTELKFTALKVLEKDSAYNSNKHKESMLIIMRISTINLEKTGEYYRGYDKPSGMRYENIELRVPVHLISNAREVAGDIEKLIRYVYEDSTTHTDGSFEIRPMKVELEEDYEIAHDVHFEEIRQQIIQSIRSAKYTIWVAIAWFTDKDIYNELLIKKNEGLNIRIIISDEVNNQPLIHGMVKNFDTKIYPKVGYNRLHNKFCIIDLEYVLHGSFNWTPTASKNAETLATALDKYFVYKFADEFLELYSSVK